jgi:hypothetical protein
MRRLWHVVGWVAALVPAEGQAPAGVSAPLAGLPGYELRTLGLEKRVQFQVGASQVEVGVPVFVYFPTETEPRAARLVGEARAALLRLAGKPEWTAEELQQVIGQLEEAGRLLEQPSPGAAGSRPAGK